MTNTELLEALESSQLVSPDVVAKLRRRVEAAPVQFDARGIVNWLVEKGHMTTAQGERLLATSPPVASRPSDSPHDFSYDNLELLEPAEPEAPSGRDGAAATIQDGLEGEVDDLEVLPDKEEPAPRRKKKKSPRPVPTWREEIKRPKSTPASPAKSGAAAVVRAGDVQSGGGLNEALDAVPMATAVGRPQAPRRRGKGWLGGRQTAWDSPLFLIGGGGLLLLVLLTGVLYLANTRVSADQLLEQAKDDFHSGSYTNAIAKYDKFIELFPNHQDISAAKVERGQAIMRQAVDTGRDWPKVFSLTQDELKKIETEDAFGQARPDLADLLPTVAEGLARQAQEQLDADIVAQAHECLQLVDRYVTRDLLPKQKINDVVASLALTQHRLDRDAALSTAVAGIERSVADQDTRQAYALHKQLLKEYPELAGNELLQAAVLSASQAEFETVAYVAEPRAAETTAPPSPVVADLVTAHRGSDPTRGVPGAAPGIAGQVICALVEGAAYGFEGESGRVLWRRFVGFDTDYVPTTLPNSDNQVLLVDAARQELCRVDGRTGALVWRAAVGEPLAAGPVVSQRAVVVATRTGRLMVFDAASGEMRGFTQLPQGLNVGPAVDSRGRRYYQLGEHSNLFVISAEDGSCDEVYYLGHQSQTVECPPVVVSRYVIVVENDAARTSTLHVLLADEQGLGLKEVQRQSLEGHVLVSPKDDGRTLLVATDRGALYAFEIAPPGTGNALTPVATKAPEDDAGPLIRYPLLRGSRLWVGGDSLTKYDVETARGRLTSRWLRDDGDLFLTPPQLIDRVLIHTRRKRGLPGAAVSAIDADTGQRLWESHVGAPLAAEPLRTADGPMVTALCTSGAWFDFTPGELEGSTVHDEPNGVLELTSALLPAAYSYEVGDPAAVLIESGDARRVLSMAVTNEGGRATWLPIPDRAGARPGVFRGGALVPLAVGQVVWAASASAGELLEPFQPRVELGQKFAWTVPLAIDNDEVIVADGRTTLYRLGVEAQPRPHLVARANAELSAPVELPPAVADRTVYVAGLDGRLVAYRLPGLEQAGDWQLGGQPAWGPAAAGKRVLVATYGDELLCLDGDGNLLWELRQLPHGPLTGRPLALGDEIVLASVSGTVYRVSADTGDELAAVEVGEPLAMGPVAWGERLLVATHDGVLLVVDRP